MIKYTQIIRPLLPTNVLSVFDHFVGLALEGLINKALGKNFEANNRNLQIFLLVLDNQWFSEFHILENFTYDSH